MQFSMSSTFAILRFELIQVFKNTMFGPEGRPQHCCAWLGVASSFPECASAIVPEEVFIDVLCR